MARSRMRMVRVVEFVICLAPGPQRDRGQQDESDRNGSYLADMECESVPWSDTAPASRRRRRPTHGGHMKAPDGGPETGRLLATRTPQTTPSLSSRCGESPRDSDVVATDVSSLLIHSR